MSKTLLPSGCYDLLPPFARQESQLSATLLSVFESFGYEQVSPPMLEYSESLLAGRGAALSAQTFRVMDPGAGKVMGFRPDITLQIARIAASRLATAPRPLRLSYNGLILRMQGEQFKDDRQLRQTGIELIGASSAEADAEVVLVAALALKKAGVTAISIDLNLPGIVGSLLASEKLDNDQLQVLFEAVSHKDVSTIRTIPFSYQDTLIALIQCAGPATSALDAMERLELPESARKQCRELREVVQILDDQMTGSPDDQKENPVIRLSGHPVIQPSLTGCTITIDAAESRGFNYHSGISFSIFVPGAACEVGRGGRYRIEGKTSEPVIEATGFTLYVETLRSLLAEPARGKRLFIAERLDHTQLGTLQADGYITVCALAEYGQDEEEAARLGCGWMYKNGTVKVIG